MGPKAFTAQRTSPMLPLASSELLTVQEMARALRVNPQTLYRLVRQGLVPAVRIGKKTLRFDPAEVRATLETNESRRPPTGRRGPTAPAITFTRLEELPTGGSWLTPPL